MGLIFALLRCLLVPDFFAPTLFPDLRNLCETALFPGNCRSESSSRSDVATTGCPRWASAGGASTQPLFRGTPESACGLPETADALPESGGGLPERPLGCRKRPVGFLCNQRAGPQGKYQWVGCLRRSYLWVCGVPIVRNRAPMLMSAGAIDSRQQSVGRVPVQLSDDVAPGLERQVTRSRRWRWDRRTLIPQRSAKPQHELMSAKYLTSTSL